MSDDLCFEDTILQKIDNGETLNNDELLKLLDFKTGTDFLSTKDAHYKYWHSLIILKNRRFLLYWCEILPDFFEKGASLIQCQPVELFNPRTRTFVTTTIVTLWYDARGCKRYIEERIEEPNGYDEFFSGYTPPKN